MPANATFKQREYEKLEALAKIAFDEFVHSMITLDGGDVIDYFTWDDMDDAERAVWTSVVQAVRVGVLRGVA